MIIKTEKQFKTIGYLQVFKLNIRTGIKTPVIVTDYKFLFKKNLTPSVFLEDIAKHAAGESTPDLEIKYTSVSTKADAFTSSDGTLSSGTLELERVDFLANSRTNARLVYDAYFTTSQANTATTTIASVNSKSDFDLTSATGFNENDLIEVQLSNIVKPEMKIGTIATNNIILTKDLQSLPVGGETVNQKITSLILVYGTGATATKNTGFACSMASLRPITKTSEEIIYTRHIIDFVGG